MSKISTTFDIALNTALRRVSTKLDLAAPGGGAGPLRPRADGILRLPMQPAALPEGNARTHAETDSDRIRVLIHAKLTQKFRELKKERGASREEEVANEILGEDVRTRQAREPTPESLDGGPTQDREEDPN